MARALIGEDVQRGDRVAILLPKSIEMVASVYGVMKAGAAYVPLDSQAPVTRGALVAADCTVAAVITTSRDAAPLLSEMDVRGHLPRVVVVVDEGGGPADLPCRALNYRQALTGPDQGRQRAEHRQRCRVPGGHHRERRDEHAPGRVGDQHDQARAEPVRQDAAHRDQHRPRHPVAGQHRAEEHRPAVAGVPDEVPPDGAAQLDLIADAQLPVEVRRHLTVVEALDGEVQPLTVGRRGDGIAALGPVPVRRGEPDVEVLARPVARPPGDEQAQRPHGRGLVGGRHDLGEPPGQSPWYRC